MVSRQLKKCEDYWLLDAESFQMIYNMNDLAAIIFSRFVTKPIIVKFLHGRPKLISNIHKQAMSAHTE